MLKSYINDFLRAFYSPNDLYREIAKEQKNRSWLCVLVYCLVYIVGSFWLHFKGFTPVVSPWISLSIEKYYLVQALYILPLIFLMWILATGVLHVMSYLFGGRGKFNNLFIMTGYSLWAPWYLLIIVDCIHSTPEWLYNTVLIICIIFILIGTSIATMVEEKIKLEAAIFSSLIAFASIGLILFTYIR